MITDYRHYDHWAAPVVQARSVVARTGLQASPKEIMIQLLSTIITLWVENLN